MSIKTNEPTETTKQTIEEPTEEETPKEIKEIDQLNESKEIETNKDDQKQPTLNQLKIAEQRLNELIQKKKQIDKTLANLESNIYNMEGFLFN